ncbi:MAG: metal-dependent hydrolase [Halioglobus sp.]|nr:metal-dependent hydrolase [Halioglobus sp.]
MANHTPGELVVRKMPFEFPEDIDPHWNKDKPEWSHMVSGASLAMPFLEPYLIRTMRKALERIESDALKKEVKLYMAQEGQHFQQHRRFNDILIGKGYTALLEVEAQMKKEFEEFDQNRSLKFNLAYACGFESMALGIGHWLVRDREYLFGGSDTRVASLILWHFIEEVEHKNVAFDAYQAVYGNYFYRVFGTLYATAHVVKFSRRAYQAMLKKDGLWGSFRSRWALLKMIGRFFVNMTPPLMSVCVPGHHPSNVKDPQWYRDWIATYGEDEHAVVVLDTDNLQASFS